MAAEVSLGRCGCCEPAAPATPRPVHNRPSLDTVSYRVGTYASFRQAMIQLVSPLSSELAEELGMSEPPLTGWTVRQSDDYGIALIEMWATIADILTFYTERYANESWLRTAQRRDSVRRLAGLLGYRLKAGVSAATHLAYALDADVRLALPRGLRVQSVPKEGQQPQKFETSTALEAAASLNRVPVYGKPSSVTPLGIGRARETLAPGSHVPLPEDRVIFFSQGASGTEERNVESIEVVDERQVVSWSAPLAAGRGEAHMVGRGFKLFGRNSPGTHLVATPQGSAAAQSVRWQRATTDFFVSSSSGIDLDGTIDGIKAGTEVLIVAGGVARRRTVQSVEHLSGSVTATTAGNGGLHVIVFGSAGGESVTVMTGDATRLIVSGSSFDFDLRNTRVYELLDRLVFLSWELPSTSIPPGAKKLYVPYPELQSIAPGRLLLLDDRASDPILAEVAEPAQPFVPPGGANAEFLEVELRAGTSRALDWATAHLLGNVVAATHGETVKEEAIGDGDTSLALQEFVLSKAPVSHIYDSSVQGGARAALQVLVDRVLWTRREGLFGAGPGDRIYTTFINDNQTLSIQFGDGRHGARLPTGRSNVVASYRQGLGPQGNLEAGQLATALDKPAGIASVTNPVPALGGVDPETMDGARANAPNTVRTFDRVVSLEDFAYVAREFTGVEKALASWVWDGEERVVHLTVGGQDGVPLSNQQLKAIGSYLERRRDPNRALRIDRYRAVPFLVSATVGATSDRRNEDVREAVLANLVGYFAYDRRSFGQAVHLSDVYAVIQETQGVVWTRVTQLRYKRTLDRLIHGKLFGPLAAHCPIFSARPQGLGQIRPAELASIESPLDIVVEVSGGLE